MVRATVHAKKRLRERSGIPKSATMKMTERAYEKGIKRTDAKGRLRVFLDEQYEKNGGFGNELRVYGDFLYIFHEMSLITVYAVPQDVRKYIKFNKKN